MKKQIILVICGIVYGLMLTSCDETKYLHHTELKLMEPSVGVISTPIVMEIDYVSSNSISDTISIPLLSARNQPLSLTNNQPLLPTRDQTRSMITSNLLELKKMALDRCVAKYECDILIGARYQFITSEDGKSFLIIITGYPAKYSRIRPATANDTWMLNFMGQGNEAYYIHSSMDTIASYK